MNLSAAQTALYYIGGGQLSGDTTNANYFLNQAKNWIEDQDDWPWLEATATGASPLTVSDLKKILYVVDTTNSNKLRASDINDIVVRDPAISQTGQPTVYYLDGLTSVKCWPTTSVSLSVRYIKYTAELTGTDTPSIPTRYHKLWVDVALWLFLQNKAPQSISPIFENRIMRDIADMKNVFMSRDKNEPGSLYGSLNRMYGEE